MQIEQQQELMQGYKDINLNPDPQLIPRPSFHIQTAENNNIHTLLGKES